VIVDIHSHDFPDQIAIRAMRGMCAQTEGLLWPAGDGTLTNHLDHMEFHGIDRATSLPIATKPNMFEGLLRRACAIQSGALGERVQKMVVPFASVHPLDPDVMRHLDRVAEAGIRGVKFHSYYQQFSLANPALWPMFRKIADLGLVCICHCGSDVSWRERRGLCGPDDIAKLLKNVPALKFVAAHLGGCDGYPPHAVDQLLDTNCYIDTSSLHRRWHYDEQVRVLRAWPTERILFGTDFPWEHYAEAIAWVKSIREPEDWDALFGGNAMKLLGL